MRFVTDEIGAKVRSTEYDPFGNWRTANGQANIHMLFQSQQQDPESELYYMRARYYDPKIGRFISRDPVKGLLTNPQSQNPYAYALNNPINLTDPSGEFLETAWDVANIAYDIYSCDWTSLAVDTASAFIPFVPAGLTKVGKVANVTSDVKIADKITGYTTHGLNQAIGRDAGVGVAPQAILDAVKNPIQVIEQAEGAVKYIGSEATVILNKVGEVITSWANSSAGLRSP